MPLVNNATVESENLRLEFETLTNVKVTAGVGKSYMAEYSIPRQPANNGLGSSLDLYTGVLRLSSVWKDHARPSENIPGSSSLRRELFEFRTNFENTMPNGGELLLQASERDILGSSHVGPKNFPFIFELSTELKTLHASVMQSLKENQITIKEADEIFRENFSRFATQVTGEVSVRLDHSSRGGLVPSILLRLALESEKITAINGVSLETLHKVSTLFPTQELRDRKVWEFLFKLSQRYDYDDASYTAEKFLKAAKYEGTFKGDTSALGEIRISRGGNDPEWEKALEDARAAELKQMLRKRDEWAALKQGQPSPKISVHSHSR